MTKPRNRRYAKYNTAATKRMKIREISKERRAKQSDDDASGLEAFLESSKTQRTLKGKTLGRKKIDQQSMACLANFHNRVQHHRQEIDCLLHGRFHNMLTNRSGRLQQISRLQAVSVSILADSVDLLSTKQKAFPSPKSRATSYPFHRIAKLMMNRSHKLIEQYDRMSQHILSYDKPPGFDSEQNEDCRKLNDLIDAHGNKSKQLVRNLLGVDNPLNKSGSNDTSWSKDMWKCYAVDESRDKSPTRRVERKNWAKLAKLAEGDVRLLMTHFKEVDIIT